MHNAVEQVDSSKLNSAEGAELLQILKAQANSVHAAVTAENVQSLASLLLNLVQPINAFFENTMVMSDDPDERYHRLSLANAVSEQLLCAGDFTKIGG
jgi:glycyl-tRNA synthetase beta subunit